MQERGAAPHSRTSQIVRFADFAVDLRAGELRRGSTRIPLQEQPFQVLTVLLQYAGEIVTREKLRQRLWHSDTFVDFDNSLNTAINKIREALGDSAEEPHFVETMPRRGYRFIARLEGVSADLTRPSKTEKPSSGRHASAIDSLAVLPLENASGDPETEYLSDGIAETLMNALAQLRKIRIVPRAVAFRHRGPGVDPLKTGRELGVRAVLAGRMVQRGDDLTVSVELVDVELQARLWGGRYNRKMTDLIALQEELATEISEKLRLQLTGEEKKKLRKRPTQNDEAYRLLLKAQYCIENEWPLGARKAMAFCQQAIEIDPRYAAAYAWLSVAYVDLSRLGLAPAAEIFPLARIAARRALELDDSLAAAHLSQGFVYLNDWDFAGAEREIRCGLELNRDSVFGHQALAILLFTQAKFEEALAAAKRAIELDPYSWRWNIILGITLWMAGSFDDAVVQFSKTVEINPHISEVHVFLADAYACVGQTEKAVEECAEAMTLDPQVILIRLHVAATYAKAGKVAEARTLVEAAEKAWTAGDGSSLWIAAVRARLGEQDAAFAWLERAFQEHASLLAYLKLHPFFEALHGDPRFDALVKRIGIPD